MKTNRRMMLQIILLVVVTALLTGLTWTGNTIKWDFILQWNTTNYDSSGIPVPNVLNPITNTKYVFNKPEFNHPSFVNYIAATLPEGVDLSVSNPALLASTVAKNIYVSKSRLLADPTFNAKTAVSVSFISEGSLFRNSLGYFLFDADNPPQSKTDNARIIAEGIVFPNTSFFKSGGSPFGLRSGDSVSIDLTPAMNKSSVAVIGIGFFLVSDGFSTTEGVRSTAVPAGIFHTIPGMNTEADPQLKEHSVLLISPDTTGPAVGLIALAMEETNRTAGMGSDNDFNDVVYGISVTPSAAIVNGTGAYPSIYPFASPPPDADHDGVTDALDEFPNDDQRATSTWYPSRSGWNSLAYEDRWPYVDDYDMNDLVVNYRHRQILNAKGQVKEIEVLYELKASGAGNLNGFAVELTGIPRATSLDSAVLRVADKEADLAGAAATSPVTPATTNLVFRIFENAVRDGFGMQQGGYINTEKGTALVPGKFYRLNVSFTTPRGPGDFKHAPLYNPFLFRTGDTGIEVHLPGYPPTSAANTALFGTQDDNTTPDTVPARYYVSKKGYPWALSIPQGWQWPTERTDIVKAYPNFAAWVSSSGASQTSWYLSPSSPANIYP